MKFRRDLIYVLVLCGCLTLIATSCLKNDTEERIAAHDAAFAALKASLGITEDENIGDNIYVHFTYIPPITGDTLRPGGDDFIVTDYIGYNSKMEAFDVTNAQDAENEGLYRTDVVYGPVRLQVNQTFLGFYKAVQHMPEGSSAVMLFPHDQAFGGYEPIVYEVSLYRIIKDLAEYDSLQFLAYMDSLDISISDSLPNAPKAFYKVLTEGDSIPDLEIGDTITVSLYGYYVETDTAFVEGFPGRQFFPIHECSDTVRFALGDVTFPVSDVVNYAVLAMKIGESWELISPSDYTYGDQGFIHPYIGVYIIPPFIPLHYTIKLIGYKKMEY
jgi:hypothetical protein